MMMEEEGVVENSERYRLCVNALKGFMDDAGFSDVVIGLSGGMDSSLVAVMCADALGADRVHGVLMPGPYSTDHSVDDALDLARNLGIRTRTVSIAEPYRAFEAALAEACGGKLSGLAAENTQARCRMVCLMALSNAYGWMLVNTGNKSEAMMGYSTLYGDTAGAFAPIGGLYKTDVFAVARWRNRQAEIAGEVPPIPEHVFVKPPSAELSPDQEDVTSMGIDSQSPLRRLRDGMSAPHDKTFSRHYTLRPFVSVSVAKEVVRRGASFVLQTCRLVRCGIGRGRNPRRM